MKKLLLLTLFLSSILANSFVMGTNQALKTNIKVVNQNDSKEEKKTSCVKKSENGGILSSLFGCFFPVKDRRREELGKKLNAQGVAYFKKKDFKNAVKLFVQAIEMDNAPAMSNVGRCLLHGKGVKEDHKKAVELFQQALNDGDKDVICDLAYCYECGLGVKKDQKKAFNLFWEGAMQGDVTAMYLLSDCYSHGYGVDVNAEKANEWCALAYKNGFSIEFLIKRNFL